MAIVAMEVDMAEVVTGMAAAAGKAKVAEEVMVVAQVEAAMVLEKGCLVAGREVVKVFVGVRGWRQQWTWRRY